MKKLWKNNKIAVLFISVIVLIILIFSLMVFPLYSSRSGSKYGNRLEGIKKVKITEKTTNQIKSIFEKNDNVKKVNTTLKGKIYNVIITLNDDVEPNNLTDLCNEVLTEFSKKQIKYYDLQFFISSKVGEETKVIIGYKNKDSESISWTNNK